MNQLSEPTINNEEVFENVAQSKTYKNDHCKKCSIMQKDCKVCSYGNRGKMLNLKDKIFQRYQFYFQNKNTLHEIRPIKMMNPDEVQLMEDSYKTSKVFQTVKKQLLDNVPKERRGVCPFCMISEPTTMDHYFSESEYPEYIIFAPNLVPCCSHCNSVKGKRLFLKNEDEIKRTVIHLYYDVLPQTKYLKSTFYVTDKIPQISFWLEFENETEITGIIKKHFETLHLLERYRERSNGILSTECENIRVCLVNGFSVKDCVQLLRCKAQSSEKIFGRNYWEACIYRAMSESEDQLMKLVEN